MQLYLHDDKFLQYCKSIKLTKEKVKKKKHAVLVFKCIPMLLIMRRISWFDARGRFQCELYFTSPLKNAGFKARPWDEKVCGVFRENGSLTCWTQIWSKGRQTRRFKVDVYRGFKWCNNETRELKGNISLISGDKVKPQDLK